MRRLLPRLIAPCLLLALAPPTTLAGDHVALQGAWQLQSGDYLDVDGARIDYASQKFTGTKVLSEGHFAFTTLRDGKFWAGGAGRWQADDDRYVESPQMASYPLEGGGQYSFRYRLEGDLWTLERWDGERRVEREVWKRLPR